ncbi:hypothetical protein AQJ67_20295 [Streptomyces caeruleatus]|uniref:Uncharacterized protein n=1 Tax=Streptomyces caeruleatus TaxID=661399 RepID=A0A117RPX1_9ACTN|nr:hypothetical protein AQJ67_20295 [Streptomyces caeruleatus]
MDDAVPVGEARLDDHLHALEQLVVSGGQQGAVEGEVGGHGLPRVAAPLPHRLQRGVQGGQIGVGAALGGQVHGGGGADAGGRAGDDGRAANEAVHRGVDSFVSAVLGRGQAVRATYAGH